MPGKTSNQDAFSSYVLESRPKGFVPGRSSKECEVWGEGVLCQNEHRPSASPWPRPRETPLVTCRLRCPRGVIRTVEGQIVGQGLHRERHGRQPAVVVPRAVQLQKHTVGHWIGPKVEVCGGQPEKRWPQRHRADQSRERKPVPRDLCSGGSSAGCLPQKWRAPRWLCR